MSDVVHVFLTEAEVERAKRLAFVRNSKNGQVPNNRHDMNQTDFDMHFRGVRAEMALCKTFNFPIDEAFRWDGDKGAPDLYAGEHRVEVKCPKHEPPIIKLDALTDFKSDVVVLCTSPNLSRIDVWGCVSRTKFIRDHYVRDFGYGPRVCADTSILTHISVLGGLHLEEVAA